MTKKLLIKYIKGVAGEGEKREVLEWIERSPDNLKYFMELKNLWVYNNMPQSFATLSEMKEASKITGSRLGRLYNPVFKKRNRRYVLLAAASVVLLLTVNIWQFLENRELKVELAIPRVTLAEVPSEQKHTLYTNNGVKGYVELPDGSKVWLNSASRLTYPDRFNGATREVLVAGEAFFEVVKDSLKPMIVNTNRDFMIEVLGTKFNIRSYDNDYEAQTTLISGSINLIREKNRGERELIAHLSPKESFVIRDKNAPVLIKQIDTTKQIAWKNGQLIFEATPIPEVLKKLERWHGTKFIIVDPDILNAKLTANFRSESIVQIMEMIKFCTSIDYSVTENIVTLHKKS